MLNFKKILGFDNPKESIIIFRGNTYQYNDWFQKSRAKYSIIFGWYLPGSDEPITPLPYGIEPVELKWTMISDDGINLKQQKVIQEIVGNLTHFATRSNYVGQIGDRLEVTATLKYVSKGSSVILYLFEDINGNEFLWFTKPRLLYINKNYIIRGTVKSHRLKNNSKQTILTNCYIKDEKTK